MSERDIEDVENSDVVGGVYCRKCNSYTFFHEYEHRLKCVNCGWTPTGPNGEYDD